MREVVLDVHGLLATKFSPRSSLASSALDVLLPGTGLLRRRSSTSPRPGEALGPEHVREFLPQVRLDVPIDGDVLDVGEQTDPASRRQ